ncbi:hypothetical protein, partial [uncultured Parasutterella sp.]|uniref:hypothetical protein n=1 Tax=uncultured Parasutterella sp. TaxID=1263098 RepID=UPI00272A30C9
MAIKYCHFSLGFEVGDGISGGSPKFVQNDRSSTITFRLALEFIFQALFFLPENSRLSFRIEPYRRVSPEFPLLDYKNRGGDFYFQ